MKNIIKKIVLVVLLNLSTSLLQAQTVGTGGGSYPDIIVSNGDNSPNYSQLRMQTGSTSTFSLSNYGSRLGIFYQPGNTGAASPYGIYQVNAATTDLFTILPSGNVGINTNNPLWKLDVGGNGYFNGNVGIGANPTSNSYRLSVAGTIAASNYAVVAAFAADYVFEDDYKLITLSDTEAYIKANKHLPAFKSAKHYEAHGYTMTEMNIALEQTVEELTLHAIAQEKEINAMKSELAEIKALLLTKK